MEEMEIMQVETEVVEEQPVEIETQAIVETEAPAEVCTTEVSVNEGGNGVGKILAGVGIAAGTAVVGWAAKKAYDAVAPVVGASVKAGVAAAKEQRAQIAEARKAKKAERAAKKAAKAAAKAAKVTPSETLTEEG